MPSIGKLKRQLLRKRANNRVMRQATIIASRARPALESAAERRGYQRCIDEHTRFLEPPKRIHGACRDAVVIGEEPKVWYYQVPLLDGMSPHFTLDEAYRYAPSYALARMQIMTFRVVKKSWADNRGNVVCWFDHEPTGIR